MTNPRTSARRPALMRGLVLLVGLAASAAFGQSTQGVYAPKDAPPVAWSINQNLSLMWGGQPYLPVGLQTDGNPAAIERAQAAGATDLIVDLPAVGTGWADAFATLERLKLRYLLRIDSLAPMAKGFVVEPQGYRVTGITQAQTVEVNLPGATGALAILALRQDGSILKTERVKVDDGRFRMEIKPLSELEHVLLIYPEMRSLEQPDYWDSLDEHRDTLLASLRRNRPGPGLRGIVNPLGNTVGQVDNRPFFVPTNPFFRYEFRNYLEQKYRNVETATRAWSIRAPDLQTFEELAELVPLWNGSRGVPVLYGAVSGKSYTVDSRRSTAWGDIQDVIVAAGARRMERLVAAIRTVADVPVVQEWKGWSAVYDPANPSVDGVGMRAAATRPTAALDQGSRAASSVLRWNKPGWLVATDLDLTGATEAASFLPGLLDDFVSMGARGIFVRTENAELAKGVAALAANRAADTAAANARPFPVFFPENALNPATPQRLPGGRWWMPTPYDGNRIDLGAGFFAYRMVENQASVVAMWVNGPPVRVRLRMADAKTATFTPIDGSDPRPKIVKGGVEVDLGPTPLMIGGTSEIPIPQPAFEETVLRFDQMLKIDEGASRVLFSQENFIFRDNIAGFERNPGGSYAVLREQFWSIGKRIALWSWIEAESARATNFSEVLPLPGASGGNALSLQTQLGNLGEFFAEYPVTVRSVDEQEVWIAARLPGDSRKDVAVLIGGQRLTISEEPVSAYGDGYAWYRLGTTRLAGDRSSMRLVVNRRGGIDLAIDAIVLTPVPFRPNGVTPPDPMPFAPIKR